MTNNNPDFNALDEFFYDDDDDTQPLSIEEEIFSKESIERFEQMFQTGNFDFECRSGSYYDGGNVLHYAVMKGDLKCVKQLLECGANIKVKDKWGRNVLNYAALSGNLELVQ